MKTIMIQKRTGRKMWKSMMSFALIFALLITVMGCTAMADDSKGLAVKVTVEAEGGENEDINNAILDNAELSLCFGADADGALANLTFNYENDTVLSFLTKLTKDSIQFQIPEVDETVYQVTSETASESLSQLFTLLQGKMPSDATVSSEDITESAEQFGEALTPIITTVMEHIESEAETMENISIQLDGTKETVDGCSVFVYKPDAAQIESLMLDLADTIEADEALDAVAQKMAEGIRNGTAAYSSDVDIDQTQIKQVISFIENMRSMIPMYLRQNAAGLSQSVAQSGLQVSVATSADGSVWCFELSAGEGSQEMRFIVERSGSGEENNLYLSVKQGTYEIVSVNAVITREESFSAGQIDVSSPQAAAAFSVLYTVSNSQKSSLGLPYGEYVFNIDSQYVQVVLDVVPGEDDGTDLHTLRIDNLDMLTMDESMPSKISINLESTRGENTAAAPQGTVQDISSYTDEQIGELLDSLEEAINHRMEDYFAAGESESTPSGFADAFTGFPAN